MYLTPTWEWIAEGVEIGPKNVSQSLYEFLPVTGSELNQLTHLVLEAQEIEGALGAAWASFVEAYSPNYADAFRRLRDLRLERQISAAHTVETCRKISAYFEPADIDKFFEHDRKSLITFTNEALARLANNAPTGAA